MKKIIAIVFCAAILLSAILVCWLGSCNKDKFGIIAFDNISEGQDKISMTDLRTYTATFQYGKEIDISKLDWYLIREEGMLDEQLFPNQYMGGRIEEWKVAFGEDKDKQLFYISDIKQTGKNITMSFYNQYYFFSTDSIYSWNGIRNYMMDYLGDYSLECRYEGRIIARCSVRISPYDSYRTSQEISYELCEAADKINTYEGMYAEVCSIGNSSMGYDIPYLIITDKCESLDAYREQNKMALKDPEGIMRKIRNNQMEYKIPVMYTSVHPDETDGADSIMEFVQAVAENNTRLSSLTGFTEEGKKELSKEMEANGAKWSNLVKDYITGLGYITAGNKIKDKYDPNAIFSFYASGKVDLNKYYNISTKEYTLKEILEKIIFIIVPLENPDGRVMNTRCNSNGFDLNRDTLYQTQDETQAMARLITQWNPVSLVELHGYNSGFQIEPCTPPHSPNVELDLQIGIGIHMGEAFGNSAVAGNDSYNSYTLCMRDYFIYNHNSESYSWDLYCWDDMSSNYTPQYAALHGTVGLAVELPYSGEQAIEAAKHGLLGHSQYVYNNTEEIYINQLRGWLRGAENIDASETTKYYVNKYDMEAEEAEILRPSGEENGSFFPEYFVLPINSEDQRNLSEVYNIQEILLNNGIVINQLDEDVFNKGFVYRKGSIVIDMHQSKRNVANAILGEGNLLTDWYGLYSSFVSSFPQCRGFDCIEVRKKGLFKGKLTLLKEPIKVNGSFYGTDGFQVVIKNDSLEAVKAINYLIDKSRVGFITEGDYKGNFVVSYRDYIDIKDKYILKAIGIDSIPIARLIKKPTIYVGGRADSNRTGLVQYDRLTNTGRSCDIYALQTQMGFTLTDSLDAASCIAGSQCLTDNERYMVEAGMPYVAYGPDIMGVCNNEAAGHDKNSLLSILKNKGLTVINNQYYDSLFYVTYKGESLITAAYEAEGDRVMYGLGGSYFTQIPYGAKAIIYNSSQRPLAGFFEETALSGFVKEDNIQAFIYDTDQYKITAFANSLTSRCHQTDDYRYLSNAIYLKCLGEKYTDSN